MRILLSKKQDKLLKLIEMLSEDKRWYTLQDLTDTFSCTERMIKNDLAEIKELFPQYNLISSHKGIKIVYEDNLSLEIAYKYFYDNSLNFKILNYVFFHPNINIEDLANEFYLSVSSLYRIISDINNTIKLHYSVFISKNPVKISGKELDVRYFFSQFFAENHYFFDWAFPDIDEKALEEFVIYFFKNSGFPMSFSIFNTVKVFTAVNIERIKDNNSNENDAFLKNKIDLLYSNYSQLPDFSEKISYFEDKLGLSLHKENLEQLFIFFIQENFFFSFEEFIEDSTINKYTKSSLDFLNTSLEELTNKYSINISNKPSLVLNIHNTAHLDKKEMFYNYILFDKKKETLSNLENIHPEFYNDVEALLNEYLKVIRNKNNTLRNHLIYTLYIHWLDLFNQLSNLKRTLKVLIISSFDTEHAVLIKDTLEYYTPNRFEYHIQKDISLTPEQLNSSNYDIIMANFMIPQVEDKKFICIQNIPILEVVNKLNNFSLHN